MVTDSKGDKLTSLITWQVNPAWQAVAPAHPIPPHWPYCAILPVAVLAGALAVVEAWDEDAGAEDDAGADEEGKGAEEAPAGGVVGTVEGWRAVFQVAVVGQAVVATVGDVVAYGVGPGTKGSNYKK